MRMKLNRIETKVYCVVVIISISIQNKQTNKQTKSNTHFLVISTRVSTLTYLLLNITY